VNPSVLLMNVEHHNTSSDVIILLPLICQADCRLPLRVEEADTDIRLLAVGITLHQGSGLRAITLLPAAATDKQTGRSLATFC